MGCGSSAFSNSPGSIDRSVVEQIVRQVALEYLGKTNKGSGPAPQLTVLASARHIYQKAGFKLVRSERHRNWGPPVVSEHWDLEL